MTRPGHPCASPRAATRGRAGSAGYAGVSDRSQSKKPKKMPVSQSPTTGQNGHAAHVRSPTTARITIVATAVAFLLRPPIGMRPMLGAELRASDRGTAVSAIPRSDQNSDRSTVTSPLSSTDAGTSVLELNQPPPNGDDSRSCSSSQSSSSSNRYW